MDPGRVADETGEFLKEEKPMRVAVPRSA